MSIEPITPEQAEKEEAEFIKTEEDKGIEYTFNYINKILGRGQRKVSFFNTSSNIDMLGYYVHKYPKILQEVKNQYGKYWKTKISTVIENDNVEIRYTLVEFNK